MTRETVERIVTELDRLSRQRALTEWESRHLEKMLTVLRRYDDSKLKNRRVARG